MSSTEVPGESSLERLTGYQFFLWAVFNDIKSRFPDSSRLNIEISEVDAICSESWESFHHLIKTRFEEEAEAVNQANLENDTRPRIKRPLSAFMLFRKRHRKSVKNANPDLSPAELSAALSIMWAKSDKEVKLKYKRLSRKQRERYRAELEAAKKAEGETARHVNDSSAETVPTPSVNMEVDSNKQDEGMN